MEIGMYTEAVNESEIPAVCRRLAGTEKGTQVFRVCERYGDAPEDFHSYDVYKTVSAGKRVVIKKANQREAANYERYLKNSSFRVPALLGTAVEGDDLWIMIDEITGSDLRDMTDELAVAAAESIAQLQNAFWNCGDTDRFEVYMKRIHRR